MSLAIHLPQSNNWPPNHVCPILPLLSITLHPDVYYTSVSDTLTVFVPIPPLFSTQLFQHTFIHCNPVPEILTLSEPVPPLQSSMWHPDCVWAYPFTAIKYLLSWLSLCLSLQCYLVPYTLKVSDPTHWLLSSSWQPNCVKSYLFIAVQYLTSWLCTHPYIVIQDLKHWRLFFWSPHGLYHYLTFWLCLCLSPPLLFNT